MLQPRLLFLLRFSAGYYEYNSESKLLERWKFKYLKKQPIINISSTLHRLQVHIPPLFRSLRHAPCYPDPALSHFFKCNQVYCVTESFECSVQAQCFESTPDGKNFRKAIWLFDHVISICNICNSRSAWLYYGCHSCQNWLLEYSWGKLRKEQYHNKLFWYQTFSKQFLCIFSICNLFDFFWPMQRLIMRTSAIILDRLPNMTGVSGWTTSLTLVWIFRMYVSLKMLYVNNEDDDWKMMLFSALTTLMEMSSFHKLLPFWSIWDANTTWQPRLRKSKSEWTWWKQKPKICALSGPHCAIMMIL